MVDAQRIERAEELMLGFAERTGVHGGPQRRYLWTDAFAVCNLLGLARATGREEHRELALRLIERVHQELGRYRPDDTRVGWLSGPAGRASEEHPTLAGLRIGKPLPERPSDQLMDARLEWDRDGQYFHYLTKWMHALDQTARQTGDARANAWARELMGTAHAAFAYSTPTGERRMYWKMGVDLSRPLVPSMGHHDPLDGYVTAVQLARTAATFHEPAPRVEEARADFATMMEGTLFSTDDPLGLGGLLTDAYWLEQLLPDREGDGLLIRLLDDAAVGLLAFARDFDASESATRRLAFRELGLATGLSGLERMLGAAREGRFAGSPSARVRLVALEPFVRLREPIVRFWLNDANRRASTWTEHRDINEVMLATSLVPDGFLELEPVDRAGASPEGG